MLSNRGSGNIWLPLSQFFFIISLRPLESSTTAKQQTLQNTDDWNAKKERHQTTKLCNKLKTRLWIVVNVLIFSWAHVEFQDNCVWNHACNALTWTCYQSLLGLYLNWSQWWIWGRSKISGKSKSDSFIKTCFMDLNFIQNIIRTIYSVLWVF